MVKNGWPYRYLPRSSLTTLVLAAIGPAIGGAVFLSLLFIWNQKAPAYIQPNSDFLIVDGAIERSHSLPSVDVLLVGDSSCLMDVDVGAIRRLTGGTSVGSLCNVGYVGPAGYAVLLENYFSRGRHAKAVVLMMHGLQMKRDPDWDASFTNYVIKDGMVGARITPASFVVQARQKFLSVIEPISYQPLPGTYGLYYGSGYIFKKMFNENTVVEPYYFPPKEPALISKSKGPFYRFEVNDLYLNGLVNLSKVLHDYNSNVSLIISPLPTERFDEETYRSRDRAIAEIIQVLGIPSSRVLDTPVSLPIVLFSSLTHMNPWGRAAFSRLLAERLMVAGIVPKTGHP